MRILRKIFSWFNELLIRIKLKKRPILIKGNKTYQQASLDLLINIEMFKRCSENKFKNFDKEKPNMPSRFYKE